MASRLEAEGLIPLATVIIAYWRQVIQVEIARPQCFQLRLGPSELIVLQLQLNLKHLQPVEHLLSYPGGWPGLVLGYAGLEFFQQTMRNPESGGMRGRLSLEFNDQHVVIPQNAANCWVGEGLAQEAGLREHVLMRFGVVEAQVSALPLD
jgi:hypothetical protein